MFVNVCWINLLIMTEKVEISHLFFCLYHNEKQVKLSNLQEHVPIRPPEVALSIEVYHNAKKWLKVLLLNSLPC